ncbi:Na+/H+ antiporter NhaC [Thermotalea metallivorans]|uniref:Malate-2H(+)/Na(+)-lactate antiporter n=1 Tax=Thermotalea metallivorans TaxID=520762 RepID=A0A140L7Q8_9FIRM|nr:Na+/H+ antiporter NhaC [Thermotalea metallivorans]KXG76583.1 Malate-2H(+)/Na(+)-lactate antiporter [Thermotalea metallivorans]
MEKTPRKLSIWEALIVIAFLIVSLMVTILKYEGSPHIPILATTVVAALVAVRAGYKWSVIEEGIIETIRMSMQAVLILMIIGTIIGTWILSGVVPTMIYYGLKILSPGIFLVATCLICCIVSLATGSSWTTAGTVGIALLGVGGGLEIPLPMVAGAIISGAYFGDKMSPLSDTTNLAPAMAGANLFDHVKHMIFTTGPSLIIALILYGILGMKYAGKELDTAAINTILDGLGQQFNINPLLLLPPVLVIAMVIFKVPAIPGLIGGTILGGVFAAIFQGSGLGDIVNAAHYGYTSETGIAAIDDLLTRGGLDSMMWTVSLILVAMAFGGTMEKTGMLQVIAEKIMSFAKNTGSLVVATIFTSIFTNLVAGDQYLSIVLPGRMYKPMWDQKGLHPKNLSRCLEDAGTLTSPLIPWNTCGAFMFSTLGVHPFAYLPFAFLNLVNPFISIFYGFTGITMEKLPQNQIEKTA